MIDPRPAPAAPAIDEFLRQHAQAGVFPGASYLVAEGDRVIAEGAVGDAVREPEVLPATCATLYDLASLTKPLATAIIAVRLAAAGRLRLDDRLGDRIDGWSPRDARGGLTLLDLLTHRSGLPAWDALYAHATDRAGRIARLQALPPAHPPLLGVTYSCPNYLLLGFAIERTAGATLEGLFRDLVGAPLGGPDILYRPGRERRPRIAATERGNARERALAGAAAASYNAWRSEIIWGDVHDNNAHSLGGVAGNAGLFGSARGVATVAREFLPGGRGLFGDEERALFAHDFTPGLDQARSVGFQIAATPGSAAGAALARESFGHTGFTGTSLWVDPRSRRLYVLLTNRVHPRWQDFDMNALRREFHALAAGI
ncbi:MAG TPA: serine hydrolase domain-containing protein [Dongiaceae bacterium]|nr:serine hydrolase domain-containing protein [Dongiaceae bacterium]